MLISLPVINQHYIVYHNTIPREKRVNKVIPLPNNDHSEIVNLLNLCDQAAEQYARNVFELYKENSIPCEVQPTKENEKKGFLIDVLGNNIEETASNMIQMNRMAGEKFPFIIALNKSGQLIAFRLPCFPASLLKVILAELKSQGKLPEIFSGSESTSGSAMAEKLLKKNKFPQNEFIIPTMDNIWISAGACVDEKYRGNSIANQLHREQIKIMKQNGCEYLVNGHDIGNKPSSRAMDKMGYSKEYLTDPDFVRVFKDREYALRILDLSSL